MTTTKTPGVFLSSKPIIRRRKREDYSNMTVVCGGCHNHSASVQREVLARVAWDGKEPLTGAVPSALGRILEEANLFALGTAMDAEGLAQISSAHAMPEDD